MKIDIDHRQLEDLKSIAQATDRTMLVPNHTFYDVHFRWNLIGIPSGKGRPCDFSALGNHGRNV